MVLVNLCTDWLSSWGIGAPLRRQHWRIPVSSAVPTLKSYPLDLSRVSFMISPTSLILGIDVLEWIHEDYSSGAQFLMQLAKLLEHI